jgi:hypothetical protein
MTEKIDLAKNFIELKECPNCKSKNMEIRDIFDYCVIEYEKSQLDDSWIQKDTLTGDLKSTELNCLDCGYNDIWRVPKDE